MELKIKKETAKRLYPEAQKWFQEVLEETFGKECFKKRTFEDIKTFEDACEELSIDSHDVFNSGDLPDEVAYKKLKVIVKAVNQGWIPDWDNTDQGKWCPWFVLSSGFGFSYSACDYDTTTAPVGSHLCFESQDKSNYTANQFLEIYKEFLTLTK